MLSCFSQGFLLYAPLNGPWKRWQELRKGLRLAQTSLGLFLILPHFGYSYLLTILNCLFFFKLLDANGLHWKVEVIWGLEDRAHGSPVASASSQRGAWP